MLFNFYKGTYLKPERYEAQYGSRLSQTTTKADVENNHILLIGLTGDDGGAEPPNFDFA